MLKASWWSANTPEHCSAMSSASPTSPVDCSTGLTFGIVAVSSRLSVPATTSTVRCPSSPPALLLFFHCFWSSVCPCPFCWEMVCRLQIECICPCRLPSALEDPCWQVTIHFPRVYNSAIFCWARFRVCLPFLFLRLTLHLADLSHTSTQNLFRRLRFLNLISCFRVTLSSSEAESSSHSATFLVTLALR